MSALTATARRSSEVGSRRHSRTLRSMMIGAGQFAISLPLFDGTDVDQDRAGCQLIIEAPTFHPVQYGARLGRQRIDR